MARHTRHACVSWTRWIINEEKNALKNAIRSFLNLTEASGLSLQIDELFDLETNAFVNEIWYRGDSYELEQLYKSIPHYKYSFWGAASTKGLEIRKIHTGLPKIIVNTLTNICVDDMQDVKIEHIGIKVRNFYHHFQNSLPPNLFAITGRIVIIEV